MMVGITGASGFIGSHLCRYLLHRETGKVRQLMRGATLQPTDPRAEVIRGDLISPADCRRFAAGLQTIYYLAHVGSPVDSDLSPAQDASLNLVPLLTLLQVIREIGTRPHVVYFSSGGAIYQETGAGRPFRETDPCAPSTSYGIQKLAAEHYLRAAAGKGYLTATVLRVGNAYGALLPQHRLQGFIGVAVNNVLEGRPIRVFGDPENVRDYVHLDDICRITVQASAPREPFAVYNVGSGKGHSVMNVLRLIEDCAGTRLEVIHERGLGSGLPGWVVLDIGEARQEFAWQPSIDLGAGIARLFTAYPRDAHAEAVRL